MAIESLNGSEVPTSPEHMDDGTLLEYRAYLYKTMAEHADALNEATRRYNAAINDTIRTNGEIERRGLDTWEFTKQMHAIE